MLDARCSMLDARSCRDGSGSRVTLRRGFTIIELLVSISIISLLLALALPAIQDSRAAARRLQCAANLHEIGTALGAFEQAHRRYPRSFCGIVGFEKNRLYCLSPHAELLPWLDHESIAAEIDWNDSATDECGPGFALGSNVTAGTRTIAQFLCPADPEAKGMATSYRFCRGAWPVTGLDPGGAFHTWQATVPADVTDGLANTAFVSERLVSGQSSPALRNSSHVPRAPPAPYQDTCVATTVRGVVDYYAGFIWIRGARRHTNYYHTLPPNSRIQDCHVDGSDGGLYTARSAHSGGVHLLYGDGHVEFVSNEIDLKVWWAASTRAGGGE